MCKYQEGQWREAHAYFAGYDEGLARTDALREVWSDHAEAYERGYQAAQQALARRGA